MNNSMDEKLRELINNQNEANVKLDYADHDFLIDLSMETLNAAKDVTSTYIKYKKAEEKYNNAIDKRNRYLKAILMVDNVN